MVRSPDAGRQRIDKRKIPSDKVQAKTAVIATSSSRSSGFQPFLFFKTSSFLPIGRGGKGK
jgi:hypothetical protein